MLIRRIFVLVFMSALLAGCIFPFPSRPYSSAYVINEGGRLFAGMRCYQNLGRVEVGRPQSDERYWVAVATQDGVSRFELLGANQPGVKVELDNTERMPDGAWTGRIWLRENEKYSVFFSFKVSEGAVKVDYPPSGSVSTTDAGTMTWEEYKRMPDSDFGLGGRNSEGGCN